MELALIALILTGLMAALANPWLLIPAGILLGNSLILAYSALTGLWWQWAILWPLEPIVIGVSILGAMWLSEQKLAGRWISRRLGNLLTILALGLTAFIFIAALLLSLPQ
jgi:hypothetical protein